jgi:hypothetical protein
MSTSTLIPGTAANAPDGRRDIALGFKLARRWQQQAKWREVDLLPTLTAEECRQIGAGYLDRIKSGAPGAPRIVDKTPSNFAFAGLIHLALPQARLIHVCREAVDTSFPASRCCFRASRRRPLMISANSVAIARLIEHWRTLLPQGLMLDVR